MWHHFGDETEQESNQTAFASHLWRANNVMDDCQHWHQMRHHFGGVVEDVGSMVEKKRLRL